MAMKAKTGRARSARALAAQATDTSAPLKLEMFVEFARPDVKASLVVKSAEFKLAPYLDGDRYIAGLYNYEGALVAVRAPEDKVWKVLDAGGFELVDEGIVTG
jgi:hypothetical protein